MLLSSEKYEANGYGYSLDFANHLTLIACLKSYKKWVHIEKYPSKARLPHSSKMPQEYSSNEQSNLCHTKRYQIVQNPWSCDTQEPLECSSLHTKSQIIGYLFTHANLSWVKPYHKNL